MLELEGTRCKLKAELKAELPQHQCFWVQTITGHFFIHLAYPYRIESTFSGATFPVVSERNGFDFSRNGKRTNSDEATNTALDFSARWRRQQGGLL
jgi:hypothetical protein